MIHKKNIYAFIQSVTPPFLFTFSRKTYVYRVARKMLKNVGSIEPKWQTITAGVAKDKKIFFPGNEPWQKEILDGTYDKFFFDYLKKIDLKNKTVLDIGSHVGFHALCFAEMVGPKGHVLTFEPNPFNADRVAMNIEANKEIASRIELIRCALSSNNGSEDFLFADDVDVGMSSGSFIESADPIWDKDIYETTVGYKRMQVETKRIDSMDSIVKGTLKPDFLKIDVEGAEGAVLEGAEMTIGKYHPLILVEIHSIYNMYSVMTFLYKFGYAVELLKKEKDGRCFLAATFEQKSKKIKQ